MGQTKNWLAEMDHLNSLGPACTDCHGGTMVDPTFNIIDVTELGATYICDHWGEVDKEAVCASLAWALSRVGRRIYPTKRLTLTCGFPD